MAGGGGEAPPVPPNADGGEFLLSLLRRPNHHPSPHQQQQSQFPSQFSPFITPRLQNQHPQPLGFDPAVAAVGPSLPILPHQLMQSNGRDVLSNTPPLWSHNLGFPQKNHAFPHPHGNQFQGNQYLSDDLQILGLSDAGVRAINNNNNNNLIQHLPQQKQQLEQKLQFGSFSSAIPSPAEGLSKANLMREVGLESRDFNGLERSRHLEKQANSHSTNVGVRQPGASSGGWVNLHKEQHQNYRPPPPGFSNKPRGGVGGNWDHGGRRRELEKNMYREKGDCSELNNEKVRRNEGSVELRLTRPPVSNPHSDLDGEDGKDDGGVLDDLGEELVDSLLLEGESDGKKDKKQSSKEYRSDSRGQNILNQRMRMLKRQMQCRLDIDWLNAAFLSIYESLVPLEEETAKQKQFFMLLEKLVSKEWPEARLYLYGSCANSFGVSKSDIDVCLAIEDAEINKSKVLLKLADILQSDNFQKVQALTRARVPIVKLMEPVSGISCDICLNNVLAVVNTKLLRDYAQIDVRLRQLAFIVKHWAKSRGVNATYQGTLSSYAYVLMCIHFLQQRRPAILPCLQEMGKTYSIIVDDIQCAYFDQVEKLHGFGSRNKETIAQLVWAFFNYWAYRHDYANAVISVRTGSILSKREKDWTRRIGNDRHLICIEDPFEISHDLGRVVDKFSIKVLREEFERAADIMQYDPNPGVTLFEPYNIPS
ncbi:hypothetical protein OIU77_010238 [Salix suchowensis]|uniref:UTP:RNA uridylyltransferase 1 n=1 Tax=Salix suchowensis TaxID=1278906 RepID=A0ABQ9A7L9_9ROSI|nr:hypothetical protein OIU77_010238 [Salix suchowensis]